MEALWIISLWTNNKKVTFTCKTQYVSISSMFMPGVAQFFKTKLTLHKLPTRLTLLKMPPPTSLIHSFTHSLTHSFTHSLTHSFTHSLTHSFTHSLTHSFTHSFIHSLIHSLIHLTNLTNLK